MLRSIFSLIHRILDSSEKKYTNTKSKAVIYCFTNPDDTVNMNLEIADQRAKIKQSVQYQEAKPIQPKQENSFSIKTEHGDVITCKHKNTTSIIPKGSKDEQARVTFCQPEDIKSVDKRNEVDAEVQPNVHDLIKQVPKKRLEISTKAKDQISLLLEQIQKMKTGLERLQEIALQFNCSDRFTEDINFLVNKTRPRLEHQAKKNNSNKTGVPQKT